MDNINLKHDHKVVIPIQTISFYNLYFSIIAVDDEGVVIPIQTINFYN